MSGNRFEDRVWQKKQQNKTESYTRTKRPKSKTQWQIININEMQIVLI